MKIGLLQMPVVASKEENLRTAYKYIYKAAEQGAKIAVLPEMFICPYENKSFVLNAEERGGNAFNALAGMAKDNGITLVAGSIPEMSDGKLYNTCFVFNPKGEEIACHRKVHLFDIAIEGGQRFMESEVFSPGDKITLFEAEGHTLGLAICFDIRFPEMFRIMSLNGAEAAIVPAAFNMTTGPLHWNITYCARALDNQMYTVGVAPARDENSSYVSYANSIICSPWGQVERLAGIEPNVVIYDLDFNEVRKVRSQLPLLSARRPDVYCNASCLR